MKYVVETNLSNFGFWSGAKDNAAYLTSEELDSIEDMLEDVFIETPTETQINDLFWFDFENVCSWIGLDAEEVYAREID